MRRAAVLGAVCLLLSGCGAVAVTATVTRTAQGSHTSHPSAPHGTLTSPPGTASGHVTPSSFSAQAAEVVIAFADAYINWNSHTVSSDMQTLAAESIGQAHSAMELAAGQTARDYELQRGGIVNSGQIEAVGPLTGSKNAWVVVTRERTTATSTSAYQGLAPAWHVTVASAVELSSGRWVVSQWQPEN